MTHQVTTIEGHTVAITGPDAQGLALKLRGFKAELSDDLVLAVCRSLEPSLFKDGLKPLAGDGQQWAAHMAEIERSVREALEVAITGQQAQPALDIKPPNESGETLCKVRWMAETPNGWVGSYNKAALEQFAAPQQVQQGAAEHAGWQYRWTNPGNDPRVNPSDIEWRQVKTSHCDTVEEEAKFLASYTYNGKPIYEVRAVYTASQTEQQREVNELLLRSLAASSDLYREGVAVGWHKHPKWEAKMQAMAECIGAIAKRLNLRAQ